MHKQGFISVNMKSYMTPDNVKARTKANAKMHKTSHPLRLIITSNNHLTGKVTEIAGQRAE